MTAKLESAVATVFWFTGLSGAGKTTLTDRAVDALEKDGLKVLVLDGDDVRERLHRHLGFGPEEIKENNRLIAGLCVEHRQRFDLIFVPIISPYRASREDARARLGDRFFEIFVHADLDTVMERDVKGLYAKAKRGEIDDMIGYSSTSPYEPPACADLTINTAELSVDAATQLLVGFVKQQVRPQGMSD